MKKSTKIIAIAIPTAFFALYVPLFLVGLTFPGSNSGWPSECSTGFTIIYDDVTKYNESKIKETIHFANIDGSQYGAYKNWWDYIKVSKPGSDGTSSMGVPGVFRKNSEGREKIITSLESIDGILRVEGGKGISCN